MNLQKVNIKKIAAEDLSDEKNAKLREIAEALDVVTPAGKIFWSLNSAGCYSVENFLYAAQMQGLTEADVKAELLRNKKSLEMSVFIFNSKKMKAKYDGKCSICSHPVSKKQEIIYDRKATHTYCY